VLPRFRADYRQSGQSAMAPLSSVDYAAYWCEGLFSPGIDLIHSAPPVDTYFPEADFRTASARAEHSNVPREPLRVAARDRSNCAGSILVVGREPRLRSGHHGPRTAWGDGICVL